MKTLSEIKSILRAHAPELHEKFGISELSVFGSVVRGEANADSDVDLLVVFDRPIGLFKLCSAENYLIALLGVEVDLVPREDVRPVFKERIYAEAVPV
jgi:uncharacterized protein